MSSLDKIKEKLKIKPVVEERKPVEIVIPIPQKQEKVKINVKIEEKIDPNFDREGLKRKLMESKLAKVTIKEPKIQKEEEKKQEVDIIVEPPEKKAKKMKTKKIIILEEEDIPVEEEKREKMEEVEIVKPRNTTKKQQKGIVIIEPHEWVRIGDTSMKNRLPIKQVPINLKVPSYYMNNREKFINFINSLFEPYKKEIENLENTINCSNINNTSEEVTLLTHQKLIRDYMNLYTPYRGLLLFHGLGSGKTASSIAIAEGMKDKRNVIVMTPASLKKNYMVELKKYGDTMYKRNQYWEWISLNKNPEALETLSTVLNLPVEYIKRKKGAWLVNVTKKSNYNDLTNSEKTSLDKQIDEMIENKYNFIKYNGLSRKRFAEMTNNFETNLFDNSVVIIDEAHNLISRIVNKYESEKDIPVDKRGEQERIHKALSRIIYEQLLRAKNCRIILLSGTPIINYPNEIGVLFNILRGYIKTWEIPLEVKSKEKIDVNYLREIFMKEKVIDYIDYSPSSSKLFITRNPFGFKNKIKETTGYQGVTNEKKNDKGDLVIDEDYVTDDTFEKKVIGILKSIKIDVQPVGIKIHNYTALPSRLDQFIERFIDPNTGELKNINVFKRRIVGLTSYFRSAQEDLLPKFDKKIGVDYHIVKVPMSDYQFNIYESARIDEREVEKKSNNKSKVDNNVYEENASSTFRIFSRLFCNYAMDGRPTPIDIKQKNALEALKKKQKEEEEKGDDMATDVLGEKDEEPEDILLPSNADEYKKLMNDTMNKIKNNPEEYLSPKGLEFHSPKYLQMLENIKDPEHKGLHLVYSQFRTMEGIGIFSLVLEANGFARFKIKKNYAGVWELDMNERDAGKPTYVLYTGTEGEDEKEIIRNIYNGDWGSIPTNIETELKEMNNNNNMGEIIKVFMITSSGSEGISLYNTRYVHIMEPYWHPVRVEQVIGRARRICSHRYLPKELQTVEVFIYLMTFTEEQKKSDEAKELRLNDLSKRAPHVPITSDEHLYEISSIKENITSKLVRAVKETSIDCAVYSKVSKEGLHCISFGEPKSDKFTYVPDIEKQKGEMIEKMNKKEVEWVGDGVHIQGVLYISRKMSNKLYNIYDYDSYKNAVKDGSEPRLVGTVEIMPDGKKVFKPIVI